MIIEQIYEVITTDQDVINIMGTRLLPMRLQQDPETPLPAAVFQVITTDPVNSLDGDSGLDLIRLQIKAWADTYTVARSLGVAIRNALIGAASLKLVTELIDDDQDEATKSYVAIMQFSVWSEFEGDAVNPITSLIKHEFEGDGATTSFAFPSIFRSGTLMIFENGTLMEATNYTELSDRSGVTITPAPAGGAYVDKFLAYYAKD